MLKKIAIVYGVIFIFLGVLGFIPSATPDGDLLGIFYVNAYHNVIHFAVGVIALWTGCTSPEAARIFFKIFGIIYAIVAILGFAYGSTDIFGILANNTADKWLHLIIAIITLYIGFGLKERAPRKPKLATKKRRSRR